MRKKTEKQIFFWEHAMRWMSFTALYGHLQDILFKFKYFYQ